jgi:hypothetical protein
MEVVMQNVAYLNTSLTQLNQISRASQFQTHANKLLSSNIEELNLFLEGGLQAGCVSEWGMPYGQGGRSIASAFVAGATTQAAPDWCLWISCKPNLMLYPPAWKACGVDLKFLRVAYSSHPIEDLRSVFLEKFFPLIVIDSPRGMDHDSMAFLARQARLHNQMIFILRDHFLSSKRGNVWAKYRFNCWQESPNARHCIQVIRGYSPRQISLTHRQKKSMPRFAEFPLMQEDRA